MRSPDECAKARFRAATLRTGLAALVASVATLVVPWMQWSPDYDRGPGSGGPWPTETAIMTRFGSISVGCFLSVIVLALFSLWSERVSIARAACTATASTAAALLLAFESFWAELPNWPIGEWRLLGSRHVTLVFVVVAGALAVHALLIARSYAAICRRSAIGSSRRSES